MCRSPLLSIHGATQIRPTRAGSSTGIAYDSRRNRFGIRLALGYGLLMTAARTLGEFGAVLVLGGSISGQTQTATTFIHDAIEERHLAGAYGMAMVLAVVSVALLLVLEFAKSRRQPATAGKAGT